MTLSRDAFVDSNTPIEPALTAIFSTSDPLTIFDVGACEGEDTVRYARLFPEGRVIAVEPLPGNVTRLRDAVTKYGCSGVEIISVALAEHPGRAEFYVSSGTPPDADRAADWDYGNKSSSLLRPGLHLEVHPWCRFDEVITVDVSTLGAVAAERGIVSIDFLHLDVQGAELEVLRGAGALLHRISLIWLEVEEVPLYQGQPVRPEVEAFMGSNGFERLLDTVGAVSGDQLYASRSRVPEHLRRRAAAAMETQGAPEFAVHELSRGPIGRLRRLLRKRRS